MRKKKKGIIISQINSKWTSEIFNILVRDRKERKIKLTDVSVEIGINKSGLWRMESGKSIPNLSYIEKYASFLGYELKLIKK